MSDLQHNVSRDILTKKKVRETWTRNGRCAFREDSLPGLIEYDKNENIKKKEYYDDNCNLVCREIIKPQTGSTTASYFDIDGKLHKDYLGPARVRHKKKIAVEEEYWKHGSRSRYLNFAYTKRSHKGNLLDQQAYLDGIMHSSHGPARAIYKGKRCVQSFLVVGGKQVNIPNVSILFEPSLMDDTLLPKFGLPPIPQSGELNERCMWCYQRYTRRKPKIKDILDEGKYSGILIQCNKCLQTCHYWCLLNAEGNHGRCFNCGREFSEPVSQSPQNKE